MDSSVAKTVFGFVLGAMVGTGLTFAVLATQLDSNNAGQLALDSPTTSSKISDINYQQIPPCPPYPEGLDSCPPQMPPDNNQQQPPNNNQSGQNPPLNQNPDPNSYPPNNNQSGQPGSNQQPPTNGQYPDQNRNQGGQPGPQGQYGQTGRPYTTLTELGPPPDLNFQRPAGLDDPDKCFREKGGEALVTAVRSSRMTPALMSSAARCFVGNFNAPGSSRGPGQSGQGGSSGPGGQPYGQMAIFSGDFIRTMSSVRPPANDCVAKVAGEAVAEKMFSQGVQPDSVTRDKIYKSGCFGPPPGGAEGTPGQPGSPGRQFVGPPIEVVDCLNKIAGNGDIQSGKRVPTPAEYNAGKTCYAQANAVPFFVPPHEVPESSPLAQCAKAVIGVTDISTITPNNLTRDQKQRMRQCYAPAGEQAMATTQPSLPQEAADCVKKIMGEAAFAQVSTGKYEPTADQRKAVGTACFQKKTLSKIAELSEAAVPLTQTQALMADVDADLVSSPKVLPPSVSEVSQKPDDSSFELTGELGDSADVETVDVYYNSESNIVTTSTTKSDSGQKTWSTKVAYGSLSQDEEHTLYAVMTKSDGTVVRSPLVAFEAKAAADASAASDATTSRNALILYGALGVVLLAILGFVVARRRRKLPVA